MLRILALNALFWLVFLYVLIAAIRNKRIAIEYSVNWVLSILLILVITSSVGLLNKAARFLGITYPPALLIVLTFYLQIVMLLYFTMLLTKLATEKKILLQDFLITNASYTKTSDVLVLLPAFNEEKNIASVVQEISNSYSYDILVIDDGSSDRTKFILNELSCMSISHSYNCGYGVALETGYKFAHKHAYDYVIQFDSDGQHDVGSIGQLFERISKTDDDVVIGSRFLAKDGHYNAGVARNFGMQIFRFLLKIVLNKKYSDPTSGLQILNREVIDFYTTGNRFPDKYPDANMILLLNLNGFNVSEIPVTMYPNSEGQSMHSGFIKPFIYMVYMALSIFIVMIQPRNKREATN